jgi:hypothetical protein
VAQITGEMKMLGMREEGGDGGMEGGRNWGWKGEKGGMGRRRGGGMSYLFALFCQLSEKMRQKIWHQQNTSPPNSPFHIHIHIQ